MSAAPKLRLHPDAAEAMAEGLRTLDAENRALRTALAEAVFDLQFAKQIAVGQTHAVMNVHEVYGQQLARLQEQVNDIALAASLVPSLEKKIAEVGRVADRSAQLLTIVNERTEGLAARESL